MTRTTTGRWRIARTMEPTLPAVERVCADVRRKLKGHAMPADWYGVELLLREALTNAVLHGGGTEPGRRVRCEVRVGPCKARLAVADEGPGFDWRAALRSDPAETATCGRGLKIYGMYADRVSFNEAGNRVVLERWFMRQREKDGRKEKGNHEPLLAVQTLARHPGRSKGLESGGEGS